MDNFSEKLTCVFDLGSGPWECDSEKSPGKVPEKQVGEPDIFRDFCKKPDSTT
jgi:hypothetical protein